MNMDEMQLPAANVKEDLETLSSNKFKLLFEVARFEIRSEDRRDKGIDFSIEIKKNGAYTNFRSVVQLKATGSISANNDGSYSLQIQTSNINYLFNSVLPAFYVLYVQQTDTFYYEELGDFIQQLQENNADWETQETNVLRFNKFLNASAVDGWYNSILKKGKFQRQIHERMAVRNAAVSPSDKIAFDIDLNVTDDAQIRNTIETYGILMDNQGRWNDIIKLHKQATGTVATTAKYNLMLGIANYHTGNLSEAMSFFKAAVRLKEELSPLLQNHLQFFDITTRYSIGILSEVDYLQKIGGLESHPSIGLYVKLDKAKRTFLLSEEMHSEEKFNNFQNEIQSIIDDANADTNVILEAKCELILYEGYRNNINYVKDISGLNLLEESIGTDVNARKQHAQAFVEKFMEWYINVQKLKEEAVNSHSHFTCHHAMLNEVKITYEFCVYRKAIQQQREANGFPKEQMYDQAEVFNPLLKMLDEVLEYYSGIDHVLNKAATLALKYEIMHYVGNMDEAQTIFQELGNLIENNDLVELKERFDYLKIEGPMHTRFDAWIAGIFEKRKKYAETSKQQSAEMEEMDRKDKEANKPNNGCYKIHLFPIGYFQLPKEKLQTAFEILNVNVDRTKKQFENMLASNIVPIANLYNNPITQEGPLNGMAENKGLEGWENLYRVRKAFYENKFYRVR
jgi:hypothetical protein